MNLIDYINSVFEENGVLTQMGGRSVSEQHQYAIGIAKSILHNTDEPALSLLQADTGIGKSFGYLIPLMIHIAITPDFGEKKFIISTYTRQLQKQIFSEDIPFVRKILEKLELPSNQVVCFRMGKQAFFSLSRVRNISSRIMLLEPHRAQEMKDFLFAVEDICIYGNGIWADYIEEYGDFPVGIKADDICLLQHQKDDNEAYLLHLEKTETASIIITNHHSILTPDQTKLSGFEVEAVIVDEAHKIGAICQDMFNHRLNLNEISSLLNKAANNKATKVNASKGLACLSQLEVSVKSHPKYESLDFISVVNAPESFETYKGHVSNLYVTLNAVLRDYTNSVNVDELEFEDAEVLNRLDSCSRAMTNWLNRNENQYQISAFGISKVRKQPSIATLNIRGSLLFGKIIQRITNKVILTSATLSNSQQNLSFSQIQNHLGLRKFDVIEQLSVSPSKYADMRFVLADKSIPHPIASLDNEEVTFNQKWLMNTVKMIEKAREDGETVLVLTVSHAESKLIAEKLKDRSRVSLHEKGHAIKEYTADFINGNSQVLITSAGWEGLNLRDLNGKQLIQNIVISRIPFVPPNPLFEYALEVVAKTNPKVATYKKSIEWVDAIQEVTAKLKQGFGRGTRSPDDFVMIWIADSRMPHTRTDRNSVLLNAIPSRFMNNYLDAEIFEQKRKELFFI